MFTWSNTELNEEQSAAILENDSILLNSCPGSGKTRTLTYKIALELSKLKNQRKFVIAITYTNLAADEIKERVELLGVDTSQLWIGTIHSFCLEWILKPYSLYHDDLKDGYTVTSIHKSEKILKELCESYSNITIWDINYRATTQGFEISCSDTRKNEGVRDIVNEYLYILKENGEIDFELILYYAYQILIKERKISSILSNLFPFILLDEYQDTKEIQYHIICNILRAGRGSTKTFIVGDPNQSIYQTMGGFPMKKYDLDELIGFSLNDSYSLKNNYRSSKKIIEYFENYKTYNNSINAKGINKDFNSIVTYNQLISHKDLEIEIERLLNISIKEHQISPNEICIAAPQWVHLAMITRNLIARMPDQNFNGPGMTPFSKDIENFWYKISRIILTEPSPNLYLKRLRWSGEVLNELSNNQIDTSSISKKSFLRFTNGIDIKKTGGLEYLDEAFQNVSNYLGVEIGRNKFLSEHYEAFFSSSESRIKRLQKEGLEYIGHIDTFRKVFKQKQGITISTIHGVKGTEFDVVIGFGLLDSWIPHFTDANGDQNAQKMLYVLTSRAKKHLHLISEKGRKISRYNPFGLTPTPHLIRNTHKYDII
ncbi:MAG: ATP-dependent helicase [Chitinophagales bacterium]